MMITRVWHGWTTHANALVYENLLRTEIFIEIAARQIDGYRGISLCRRELADEVEFVTIMWFDSLDAVRAFTGANYERAVCRPRRAPCCRASTRPQRITKPSSRPNLANRSRVTQACLRSPQRFGHIVGDRARPGIEATPTP